MKKKTEGKIHLKKTFEKKIIIDRQTQEEKIIFIPMHYFYLCVGNSQIFLCKQRKYHGVAQYFRQDLPVYMIYSHKWNQDKMLDKLMTNLRKRVAAAERCTGQYAA